MEHPSIILGSATHGIVLTTWRRSHPNSTDYWDGNWLSTTVRIAIGGFRGKVEADLRSEEFESFREQLHQLQQSLNGRAEFRTMEGWVSLLLEIDRAGHIKCAGTVIDDPGIGNRLQFTLEIDQSYLPKLIRELDDLLTAFPIIGTS